MTKSFKKNLLSTASMLAVVAAIPAGAMAAAGDVTTNTTLTGANTTGINFTTSNGSTAYISGGATVTETGADVITTTTVTGNTVENHGTVTADGNLSALTFTTINNSLNNLGTLRAVGSEATAELTAASSGAFTNSGLIENTGSGQGVEIVDGGGITHASGFVNTGSISASSGTAFDIGESFIVLNNSGTITSVTGNAIDITTASTGDITNSGSITTTAGTADTIQITTALTGTITNSGTVSSFGGHGLDVDAQITGLNNSGTISANAVGAVSGVQIATGLTAITFSNSGSITSKGSAAAVDFEGTASTTITNTGTISNSAGGSGLDIGGALTGAIANTGGTISSASGIGLLVGGTVSETITNSGSILSLGNGDAFANTQAIAKLVTNTGTIKSSSGIGMDIDASLTVGLTNSGRIEGGAGSAIDIADGINVAALTNSSTGIITSNSAAATLLFDDESASVITNNGTISNTGSGAAFDVADILTGAFLNAGTISVQAGNTAISDGGDVAAQFATGFTNTGTINAGATGTAIDFSTSNTANTWNNSGTIIGEVKLAGTGAQTFHITGGSITANGEADGVITAVDGATTINVSGGATITGLITGSSGADVINLGLTATKATDSFTTGGIIAAIETVNLDFGTFNIGHNITGASTTIALDSDTTTNVTENVTLTTPILNVDGTLTVAAGKTLAQATAGGDLDLDGTFISKVRDASTFGKMTIIDDGNLGGANSTIKLDFSGADKYIPTATTLTDVITAADTLDTTLTGVTFTSTSPTFTLASTGSDATGIDIVITRVTYQTNSSKQNDKNVGTALETIGAAATGDSALRAVLGSLDGSATTTALRTNLESLNPENSGATTQAVVATNNAAIGTVETQLASYRDAEASGIATGGMFNEKAVWGQVFGSTADQDERDGVKGYQADTSGIAFGADTNVTDKDRVGISFAYANTEVEHDRNSASNTDIDSFQVAVYGSHDEDKWYVDGLVGLTFNEFDQTRTLNVGANRTANADYEGTQFTAKAKAGYKHSLNNGVNLTPTLSLQYTNSSVDSYTETGSSANLTVNSQDVDVFESGLGIKASYPITHGKAVLTPEVHAEYKYDFIGDEYEATSNFTSATGTSFVSKGADVAQSTFVLGAGLDIMAQDNVTVSFGYDGSYKEDYSSHAASLKARVEF